ncbi:hypothetical protein LTR66_007539 [Elasticomyces elasticus]|nr:hypothetical protein LTR50_006187 [Elasticomyces elasticus]KAK4987659.1 hypothetical protein LTR66_007539 [Elasticomyces elasticus]
MPGLVRKLLICAAVDGLLLQPSSSKGQTTSTPSIKISYNTNVITPSLSNGPEDKSDTSLEAHGIVGLLKLASTSYLISISQRKEVAQIRGKSIYVITDVALIPLSSQRDAEHAIDRARKPSKQGGAGETVDSDVEDDAGSSTAADEDPHESDNSPATPPPEPEKNRPPSSPLKKGPSIIQDVIGNKGRYGRFADRWFSKGGWTTDRKRSMGVRSEEDLAQEQAGQEGKVLPIDDEARSPIPQPGVQPEEEESSNKERNATSKEQKSTKLSTEESAMSHLTPRIIKTTKLFFSAKSFFFSYDYDLSRSLSRQENSSTSVPLFKKFDPLFLWNHSLIAPITEAGQYNFALPIIQGFVGQRAFTIESSKGPQNDSIVATTQKHEDVVDVLGQEEAKPTTKDEDQSLQTESQRHDFLITLISRRSVKRAGLRYLRRGVDDQGNVANSVETEQLLSDPSWNTSNKTFSFVQTRGSIPLFFSQTPYSFKPAPVQYGSESVNQTAFKKHFALVAERYGDVQVASLVDKHGTEAKIGESYEHHAQMMNNTAESDKKQIGFEWFDFHSECRGMKFENVSVLMDTLKAPLSSHGWSVQQDDNAIRTQKGILRTNCMDCLDRTNVVQSAVAGYTFQAQLSELGLKIDLQTDPKTSWFNTLWADNGDAISKQYAGTAALKGDFTRTRKRNWTGALSDFSLTLNRYYNNIFGDYFLQTCIDYYLGNAGPGVFDDFEADMSNKDYALDMRQVRQNAIDTCVKIVLADPQEDLVAGWTLSCPQQANTLRTLPFEECVLLLTDAALYYCRFDWNTEKVGSFERVDLQEIESLNYGAYITSTLGPTHLDDKKNVGFVVRYKPHGEALVRTNTRSMQNEKTAENAEEGKKDVKVKPSESRVLAFKALPPSAAAARSESPEPVGMSEFEQVKHVCEEIRRAAVAVVARDTAGVEEIAGGKNEGEELQVEEKDVISVADAKKSTGLLETLGYGFKKLIWS